MTATRSNLKKSNRVTRSNLRARCWAKGMSVTDFAEKIGKSRPTLYFALSEPTRYSTTYEKIQEELA